MTSPQLKTHRQVAFVRIADAALRRSDQILAAFLPGGHREGLEYVARNPTRNDQKTGSFKVNIASGKWADWSCGDKGSDLISLIAYVQGLSQRDAAIKLADALGVDAYE